MRGCVIPCVVGAVLVSAAQGCDAFGDSSGEPGTEAGAQGPPTGGGEGGLSGPDASPPDGSPPADAAGCETTQWLSPKSAGGTGWNPLDGAFQKDEDPVMSTVDTVTQTLTVRDFGAGIPLYARIQGIEVAIWRKGSSDNAIYDDSISLVLQGVGVGQKQVNPDTWPGPTGFLEVRYGKANDTWGITPSALTPASVNDQSFGVAIVARALPTGGAVQAMVDDVLVAITYCAP